MRTRHEYLEEIIGTSQEEKYVYWLVTLLSGLLPTLIIAFGLLDPVFVFILSKDKYEILMFLQNVRQYLSKKVLQFLRYLILLINNIGPKVMLFSPVIFSLIYNMNHYHAATFSLTSNTLTGFNANSR